MAAKCKVCTKSVYAMDPQINLDGNLFHKPCAKCADCNCQLTLQNFTKNISGDNTLLLCKIHYFKRFHEEGAYVGGDKFQNKSRSEAVSSIAVNKSSNKCKLCVKSIYPNDRQLNLDGSLYHQACAKCADCKCQITFDNFAHDDLDQNVLLCKTHKNLRFQNRGGQVKSAKVIAANASGVVDVKPSYQTQPASVIEPVHEEPVVEDSVQEPVEPDAPISGELEESSHEELIADSPYETVSAEEVVAQEETVQEEATQEELPQEEAAVEDPTPEEPSEEHLIHNEPVYEEEAPADHDEPSAEDDEVPPAAPSMPPPLPDSDPVFEE